MIQNSLTFYTARISTQRITNICRCKWWMLSWILGKLQYACMVKLKDGKLIVWMSWILGNLQYACMVMLKDWKLIVWTQCKKLNSFLCCGLTKNSFFINIYNRYYNRYQFLEFFGKWKSMFTPDFFARFSLRVCHRWNW